MQAIIKQMDIKFTYTILYVQDVSKAMEFYKKVFGFEEKFITPEKDYGELKTASTTLSFASLGLARSNFKQEFQVSELEQAPFGIELAFTTQKVQLLMDRAIQNGAKLLDPVKTKPWGQQVAYIRDPNGFIIEICSPIASAD